MYGSAVGTLELDSFADGNWTAEWSRSGEQGADWLTAAVVLGANVERVRFVGTTGSS